MRAPATGSVPAGDALWERDAMGTVIVVVGVLMVALVAWLIGRLVGRQQAAMRGTPADMKRADDGGDPPFSDYSSPLG